MLSLSGHRSGACLIVLVISALVLVSCRDGDSTTPVTETPVTSPASTQAASPTEPLPVDTPEATETPSVISPTDAPSTAPAQVVSRGPSDRNAVVLTFDAGSDTGYTSQILDTLAANSTTAAFGITGRWAEQNSALLERIVSDGHELINHTYDHGSFTGNSTGAPALTQAQRWDQLERAEAIVQNISGATTKPYFRPPYGDYDDSVNTDVGARGYLYNVMWTVDSMGWNGFSAEQIVQRCLSQAEPGAIYIFHVGSASQDAAALQRVIDGLRAAGYEFVPLSSFAP